VKINSMNNWIDWLFWSLSMPIPGFVGKVNICFQFHAVSCGRDKLWKFNPERFYFSPSIVFFIKPSDVIFISRLKSQISAKVFWFTMVIWKYATHFLSKCNPAFGMSSLVDKSWISSALMNTTSDLIN
jgi:hypothetical protein